MRRMVVMGAGALVLALGIGGPGSAATEPAKAGSACPAQTFCAWSKKNFRGQRVKLTETGVYSNKLKRVMNNEASSLKNHRSGRAVLFDRANGDGDAFCIPAGSEVNDLTSFNNRAASTRLDKIDCV